MRMLVPVLITTILVALAPDRARGEDDSSAELRARITKLVAENVELQEARVRLSQQLLAATNDQNRMVAQQEELSQAIKLMTVSLKSNSVLIRALDEQANANRALAQRLTLSIDAEHAIVAAVFKAIGTHAVLPIAQALEASPEASAPILCPALTQLGAAAKPAIPALKRVAEAVNGDTLLLVSNALAGIEGK